MGTVKYTDLAAVEDIGPDEMTQIFGGEIPVGQFNSSHFAGVPGFGRGTLAKEVFGLPEPGQSIQFTSDLLGFPGNNGAKAFVSSILGVDVKFPPGLL